MDEFEGNLLLLGFIYYVNNNSNVFKQLIICMLI